ncbi:MAG: DNA repair protein RecN [Bacillota bacterium]
MLKVINLKNIALIKEGEINLTSGLNIFSGETGAGKSIIVDAMNFLLGAKADKNLIRHGETEAFASGVFDIFDRADVQSLLAEIGIEEDETLIISRKMQVDGRNEIRICGKICTLSMLKSITSKIFDVHGQSEHFALSKSSYQERLVDKFAKNDEIREEFAENFAKYKEIQTEMDEFSGNGDERERQIDVYRYQIAEIEEANLQNGEEEELAEKFKLFSSAEKLKEALYECAGNLSDENALGYIGAAATALSRIAKFGGDFEEISARLSSVSAEVEDIFETVKDKLESVDFDEEEINRVGERLDTIKRLKRKYGDSISEIEVFHKNTCEKLEKLENAEFHLAKLEKQLGEISAKLEKIGEKLTKIREEKAKLLASQIENELHEVGMENAVFSVAFEKLQLQNATSRGLDKMEFMFSANLGESQKPLAKIISGGEMSRFMLAMKNITASIENIDSMLFDEIDTGISGNVGHLVSEKFISIAKKHQVIAISHLPQICASGKSNFYIYKESENGQTFTHIKQLSRAEKIAEVSRLSGGDNSVQSLEFAESLVAKYEEIHKS